MRVKLSVLLCLLGLFSACSELDMPKNSHGFDDTIFEETSLPFVEEKEIPDLSLKQGFVSQKEDTIRIIQDGKAVGLVVLSKPVIVSQAEQEEDWGYFQFPIIFRDENGELVVKWQMRADSHSDYGKDLYGRKLSRNEGKTWLPVTNLLFDKERYRVELTNGDVLQVKDPTPKDIHFFSYFPSPINEIAIAGFQFFLESSLPEELKGVYLQRWDNTLREPVLIHSGITDDGLLRYAIDSTMPIVWWGNIKELEDGTLVAGVYGGHYQNSKGEALRSSVAFYKSYDRGDNWILLGKIPYQPIGCEDFEQFVFDGDDGFTEPAFEILNKNTYICVMRTSSRTPMYKSVSYNGGKNWSRPEPFTPNGVMPNVLFLSNNSAVLTSGRPGVQLRINIDGDGKNWTEPIEMMPYIDESGNFDIWAESCGYSNILDNGDNTFYIVYSDFKKKNDKGEYRKTILFRKVEVVKRSSLN